MSFIIAVACSFTADLSNYFLAYEATPGWTLNHGDGVLCQEIGKMGIIDPAGLFADDKMPLSYQLWAAHAWSK